MTRFKTLLRRAARDDSGNASIEFALVFPIFMLMLIASFEAGLMATRHVMLERGLDLAVRQVRLGTGHLPENHDEMKALVCSGAAIIPDCMNSVKIEMDVIDPRTTPNFAATPDCVDRGNLEDPVRTFVTGQSNQLMLMRACALFKPIFPSTGLGYKRSQGHNGEYALVSSAAYVSEPQ